MYFSFPLCLWVGRWVGYRCFLGFSAFAFQLVFLLVISSPSVRSTFYSPPFSPFFFFFFAIQALYYLQVLSAVLSPFSSSSNFSRKMVQYHLAISSPHRFIIWHDAEWLTSFHAFFFSTPLSILVKYFFP